IRVKFVTKNAAIRVTETPFAVPIKLARAGLSQVVNHLLNTATPKPFDFLVENTFLRTTLEKYVVTNHLTDEAVLTLEYVEAHLEPEESQSQNHPDWISAVSSYNGYVALVIVTGCYDGILRVFAQSGELLGSVKAHDTVIKSISIYEDVIVTGSKDLTAKVWSWDATTKSLALLGVNGGHGNSVDAVAVHDQQVHHILVVARPTRIDMLAGTTLVQATFTSHKQWVSAVEWSPLNAHQFVSSGYDGAVKLWDSRSSIPLFTLAAHTGKALDVAWLPNTKPAFVSGGEDCQLKFYATA
ncbi:hypothetical protein B5M09_000589, partial [Aphanomyces astaci]